MADHRFRHPVEDFALYIAIYDIECAALEKRTHEHAVGSAMVDHSESVGREVHAERFLDVVEETRHSQQRVHPVVETTHVMMVSNSGYVSYTDRGYSDETEDYK